MSTKEFKIFNRSNREESWIAAESARLACIQNENRLRMLRGEKQLLSEKSKAVHDSAGDMIDVSVGDSVCSGLKCNVVREPELPPLPPFSAAGRGWWKVSVENAAKSVFYGFGTHHELLQYTEYLYEPSMKRSIEPAADLRLRTSPDQTDVAYALFHLRAADDKMSIVEAA